jgi:hypothetical protein
MFTSFHSSSHRGYFHLVEDYNEVKTKPFARSKKEETLSLIRLCNNPLSDLFYLNREKEEKTKDIKHNTQSH